MVVFKKLFTYFKIGSKQNLRLLLPLLVFILPNFAFASNVFEPTSGDVSMKIMEAMFGGLTDAGGSDPLLSGIKIFNGGALIIGGILMAYTVLAGTLGTAHDGEMMGKKFSSVWVPIRYMIGTALVLPVVGGGYCVLQAIVMWLVVQGIGLADQVWAAYMSSPTSTANTTATESYRAAILAVAQNAFRNSVCYRSYAQAISNSSSVLNWQKYTYQMTQTSQGWRYGDSSSALKTNGCGNINYAKNKDTTIDTAATATSTYSGYLGDISNIFSPIDVSSINAAQNQQTDTLVQAMDALAGQAVATPDMTDAQAQAYYNQITTAVNNYVSGVSSAAAGLSNGDGYSQIKNSSSTQGWILAGAWFSRIVQMKEIIEGAVNSTPTSSVSSPALDSILFGDASKYLRTADMVLGKAPNATPTDTFGVEKSNSKDNVGGDGSSDISSSGSFLIEKIEAPIGSFITGVNLYELKNDSRHPLLIIQDLGSRIVGGMLGLMLALAVVSIPVTKILGTGILEIFKMFLGLPIQAIMALALACKYVIPNMPYMIWIGAVVGWVLLVVEAVIAAPLWAIMHLHPNGDDLTGRGGNGYMLVLSLTLRPVLMVFGLWASIIISAVIGEFINKTFFETFAANTNTFTGFSALLALCMGLMVYFSIMFIFVKKCFNIIHLVPDQLLKWIGGGDSSLGQFAGEFGHAATQGSQNVAAFTGALAGGAGRQAVGGTEQKLGQIRNDINNGEGGGAKSSGLTGFAARHMSTLMGGSRAGNATQIGADGKLRTQKAHDSFSKQREQQAQNANDKATDAEVGTGTSDIGQGLAIDSLGKDAGMSEINDFKSSFNGGVSNAFRVGGDDAKSDFVQQFAEATSNGFSNYGGSSQQAASSIGNSVATSYAAARMASFGKEGMSAINKIAGDGSQVTNGRRANMAINSFNKMQQVYSADGGDAATKMSKAFSKINEAENAYKKFKDVYSDFKSGGQ